MAKTQPLVRYSPKDRVRVGIALVATFAIGGSALAAASHAEAPPPAVAPELEHLARGVDSSNWQHPHGAHPAWSTVAEAGKAFTFIKATEGFGPANTYYESDAAAARSVGMAVGSYHFARPGMEPIGQARAFAQRLQSIGEPQLPPVLDIEVDEGLEPHELADWVRAFLHETEALTGRTPIVYTYPDFWRTKMANTTEFSTYPLWVAEYQVPQPTQPLVGGWTHWQFWQRAGDDGRAPGFAGSVDLNVFAGGREDLAAWMGPVTPQAPPPAAEPIAQHVPVPAEPEVVAPPAPADVAAEIPHPDDTPPL